MDSPTLVIATDAADPEARVSDGLSAALSHWQPPTQPPITHAVSTEALLSRPDELDRGDVLWLWLDAPAQAPLYELLECAEHRGMPTLLTRAGESRGPGALQQDGVTLCPPGVEPHVQCAMLQSLVSQAGVIRSLDSEVRLLHAQRGGLCERMGRIDEELRLAARLQQQFLPKPLSPINDIASYALWRPAHYVSGDIYDIARLDEHHIGLFLADAVGHGVPAALMTMYIKRSLKTKLIDPAEPDGYRLLEPHETLSRLNDDMIQAHTEQTPFATACYAVIDTQTREVRLARAGHPYPMVLRDDGRMQTVEPEGGLLGVFAGEQFEQTTLTLDAGNRLLLYSDGFELAFPDAEGRCDGRLASDRYREELQQLRTGRAEEALRKLERRIDSQVGSLEQQDDLTVVCLAVGEPADTKTVSESTSEASRAYERASDHVVSAAAHTLRNSQGISLKPASSSI